MTCPLLVSFVSTQASGEASGLQETEGVAEILEAVTYTQAPVSTQAAPYLLHQLLGAQSQWSVPRPDISVLRSVASIAGLPGEARKVLAQGIWPQPQCPGMSVSPGHHVPWPQEYCPKVNVVLLGLPAL